MTAEKFTVETSLIRLFAQALGRHQPGVLRGDGGGHGGRRGDRAPHLNPASAHWDPDYPLRWKSGQPWNGSRPGDGTKVERTGGGTGLHAEQHYGTTARCGPAMS